MWGRVVGGWEFHVKSGVARGFLSSVKLAECGIALEQSRQSTIRVLGLHSKKPL